MTVTTSVTTQHGINVSLTVPAELHQTRPNTFTTPARRQIETALQTQKERQVQHRLLLSIP